MARLVVVSNRVAVPTREGGARAGGLEVAIRATMRQQNGVWFGWSGRVAKTSERVASRTVEQSNLTYIVIDLTQDDYEEYYSGFANRVLWPILHYRLDLAEYHRRDLTGYLRVNDFLAGELIKTLKPDDLIWVHDYHLLPFAQALRKRGFKNKIGFFLHTPFPPPEIATALPSHDRLIPAMALYDLVGFQTEGDASNFARYLVRERGMRDAGENALQGDGREVRIGAFPVGVEVQDFQRLARRSLSSPFVHEVVESLAGRKMIIGVDRLDYSKGIGLRMEAFESFLNAHPDWHGKVTYLQITPKSRSDIREYIDMEQALSAAVGHINGAYGEVAWTPIRYLNRTYGRAALAGLYRTAAAGLVTPLRDGMNLVAKEYVVAQNELDPGVLILSRFAGASAECKEALLVNPYDPEAVGTTIRQALEMPLDERLSRHRTMLATLEQNDIKHWGTRFIASLTGGNA